MALPWQQEEANRIAQGVPKCDDCPRQTTARAANGLVVSTGVEFFFCPSGFLCTEPQFWLR